ncbi:MAG: DUF721 domain-containing protein [bacterium]
MEERLADILARANSGIQQTIRLSGWLDIWRKITDESIRKNTEPVKIKHQTLYVNTATAAWAQELSFLKTMMIEKFNEQAGEEAITDIRFSAKNVITVN